MFLKSKTGRLVELPTHEEDAAITAAAAADPETRVLTDAEWEQVTPRLQRGGRPRLANPKQLASLRLSPEVLAHFRAAGKGWQTRIDQALKEWIKRAAG